MDSDPKGHPCKRAEDWNVSLETERTPESVSPFAGGLDERRPKEKLWKDISDRPFTGDSGTCVYL